MSAAVSIIVPCYNVAPYLDVCMDSLVNQTLRDIEIICVNDGSTDGTLSCLRAWAGRDSRIRVVDRENGGLSVARNTGMDLALGDYIGFVDADDYVEHSMYQRLLEEALSYGADVTACGYTGFSNGDGRELEESTWSPPAGREDNVQSVIFHEDTVWKRMVSIACNKLYNREFLERNGLRFEPSFRQMEDEAFWMMLLAHASRLAVIPDRLYWYRRQREGSISGEWGGDCRPILLVAGRMVHAAAYWKKCGWLQSGLERGWITHILKFYLLRYLISTHQDLPRLSGEEWKCLHEKLREWFSLVGGVDRIPNLDKWETTLCRVLASPLQRADFFSRAWWKLLSRCKGRRGRYYEVLGNLAKPGKANPEP